MREETTTTETKSELSKNPASHAGPNDAHPQANVVAAPVTTDASQAVDAVPVETTETTTTTTKED